MRFVEHTSAQVAAAASAVAVLPIGSVEQHALHLPVGTDAIIAEWLGQQVEAKQPDDILLLPTLWYGASHHHLGFPGTVSIGIEAITAQVLQVAETLHRSTGVRRFVVLNGHGGNEPAMRLASEKWAQRVPGTSLLALSYWAPIIDELVRRGEAAAPMGHADRYETSLMLAARPELVHVDRLRADGFTDDLPGWAVLDRGFPDRTEVGGVGDPSGASAAEGRKLAAIAVRSILDLIEQLWPDRR